MADVAVVTDSTGYLPASLTDSLEITVMSHHYNLGAGWLRESDFDGDYGRLYAELDASKSSATTSAVAVEEYVEVFAHLLPQHSAIVSVLVSSGLSKSCSNARQAAAQLEGRGGERVVVIDTAGAGGHEGLQALAAARAAAAGQDGSGVVAATLRARQQVKQWFVVDTLEYLRRGGRIGAATAWLGSALDLKPILCFESELKAVERVRTRKRAVERLVELMRQRRVVVGADRWFVQHTAAHEDAKELSERLAGLFDSEPEFISEMGPVCAVLLGPGVLVAGGLPGAVFGGAHG